MEKSKYKCSDFKSSHGRLRSVVLSIRIKILWKEQFANASPIVQLTLAHRISPPITCMTPLCKLEDEQFSLE